MPVFGPDRLLSGSASSAVSDAASMVAEIQRGVSDEEVSGATRAKIVSHPLYPKLVQAYIDCQKVKEPFLFQRNVVLKTLRLVPGKTYEKYFLMKKKEPRDIS